METNKEVPQKQTNKQKAKVNLPYDSAVLLLGIYLKDFEVSVSGLLHIWVYRNNSDFMDSAWVYAVVWIRNVPHRFRHFKTCPPGDWHCFRRFQRCSLPCWRRGGLWECIQKFQNLDSLLWNMGLSSPCHHVSPVTMCDACCHAFFLVPGTMSLKLNPFSYKFT